MKRRLWAALCGLGLFLWGVEVHAHGGAPSVLSVVRFENRTPALLRLNEGLAWREPQGEGFRFVCPQRFGAQEVSLAVPLGADAALVVAGQSMFVLDASGAVHGHPSRASSTALALEQNGSGAALLQQIEGQVELLQVEPDGAARLWVGEPSFSSLASDDSTLLLAGLSAGQLLQLRLTAAGDELDRAQGDAPAGAVAAFARLMDHDPFLSVLTDGGLGGVLGSLEAGRFAVLHEAGGPVAGPVGVDDQVFLAADGKLWRRVGDGFEAVAMPAPVTCLQQRQGVPYACTTQGVSLLDAQGLREPGFLFEKLRAPALDDLPPEAASECELQWERYRVDLISQGLLPGVASEADAGRAPEEAQGAGCRAGPAGSPHPAASCVVVGLVLMGLGLRAR